jgi:hypothetical protein
MKVLGQVVAMYDDGLRMNSIARRLSAEGSAVHGGGVWQLGLALGAQGHTPLGGGRWHPAKVMVLLDPL